MESATNETADVYRPGDRTNDVTRAVNDVYRSVSTASIVEIVMGRGDIWTNAEDFSSLLQALQSRVSSRDFQLDGEIRQMLTTIYDLYSSNFRESEPGINVALMQLVSSPRLLEYVCSRN